MEQVKKEQEEMKTKNEQERTLIKWTACKTDGHLGRDKNSKKEAKKCQGSKISI